MSKYEEKPKHEMSDKVNLSDVLFQRCGCKTGDFVTLTQSTGTLYFNPNVAEAIGFKKDKWDQVLVGIDKASGIIVLKKVAAEEYGSVMVQKDVYTPGSCCVGAKHLIKGQSVKKSKAYKYEKNGDLIYLEAVPNTEI